METLAETSFTMQNAPYNSLVRNTNRRLKKNYRILAQVTLVGGKGRITKATLIQKDFSLIYLPLFIKLKKEMTIILSMILAI